MKVGDCSCSEYVNNEGFGNCSDAAGLGPKCYVNQPTTCKDQKKSLTYPGLQWSHYACQSRNSTK